MVGDQQVTFYGTLYKYSEENLVEPSQYTGTNTFVLLADRCVRIVPNAVIEVQIPK
jgi:hypothetical protein